MQSQTGFSNKLDGHLIRQSIVPRGTWHSDGPSNIEFVNELEDLIDEILDDTGQVIIYR